MQPNPGEAHLVDEYLVAVPTTTWRCARRPRGRSGACVVECPCPALPTVTSSTASTRPTRPRRRRDGPVQSMRSERSGASGVAKMKQTSWLSGLSAVRSRVAARVRTSPWSSRDREHTAEGPLPSMEST